MRYVMQIRIPLKRALTKMWVSLVQKWSKNSYKNTVCELKMYKLELLILHFNSVSVYVGPTSKQEVQTPIYSEKRPKNL